MLKPDNIRYDCGVKVCEKIIPDTARATKYVASHVKKGALMKPGIFMKPIGVTIHNTNDLPRVDDDAEQYTRATWPNCNMNGAVVHYYVDDKGAWQNLRENETGWHASDGSGTGNRKTIAVECIMSGDGSKQDEAAFDNAARLAAAILYRHKLGVGSLYTHNHWMKLPDKIVVGAKKNCPMYILPRYTEFKNKVSEYLKTLRKGVKIGVGTKVSVREGAMYGGLASSRGVRVPAYISAKILTVGKVANHKGKDEALLKEINSWVSIDQLIVI